MFGEVCEFGVPRLAAIDTAKNAPHKDPARAEEGDDEVEDVVRAVVLLVHYGSLLWLRLRYHDDLLWLIRWGVARLRWRIASLGWWVACW